MKRKRCEHSSARIRIWKINGIKMCSAVCYDCDLGWYGRVHPWTTQRGDLRKPPKWVELLIKRQGGPEKYKDHDNDMYLS